MPNILAVRRNVDVTAWYDRGVLEVSAPVRAVKPEGTRIPVPFQDADAAPGGYVKGPDEEPARPGRGVISPWDMSAACNRRYVRLRGEADMPALTAVTGLRSRGSAEVGRCAVRATPETGIQPRRVRPVTPRGHDFSLVYVTQNPRAHSIDDGCYRSAIWGRLEPPWS